MTYPIAPATYGTYEYFAREIGGALGYGHSEANWTHEQEGIISTCIQRGLNTFYYPPPLAVPEGKPQPRHRWSFLFPTASLSIVAGTDTYDLPADCSGRVSEFTYRRNGAIDGETTNIFRIPIVSEAMLRQSKLQTNNTGNPVAATISVKPHIGDAPQAYQVIFFPQPTVAATLDFNYEATPGDLAKDKRFPYGGRQHVETMLAGMMAAAEEKLNGGGHGDRWRTFIDRLAASIILDKETRTTTADTIWPTDNLSLTLSVTYFEIQRQAGIVMGFGPNVISWSQDQRALIDQIIDGGLRQYYVPPPIDAMRQPHEWSFLRPSGQITTEAGQREYLLPPDFERFNGPLAFGDTDNNYPPITITSEGKLRTVQNQTQWTAYPTLAAVKPLNSVSGNPQEQMLVLHPTPDGPYTLLFQYYAIQRRLSPTNPYPLGGEIHGEGVLLSCLAIAEQQANGKAGPYTSRFMQRLISNVAADDRRGPDVLGYNSDRRGTWSMSRADERRDGLFYRDVTYNSQAWES